MDVQQAVAKTNFQATESTGVISFKPNGDRLQENIDLVKVIHNSSTGEIEFVPLEK